MRFPALALLLASVPALAFVPREDGGRGEARMLPDPAAVPAWLEDLPPAHPLRAGWSKFGGHVRLDVRSGAPLLVIPDGLDWPVSPGHDGFERSLRAFFAENRALLQADVAELVFDGEASGPVGPNGWRTVVRRQVRGVPVEGDAYLFTFGYGRLVYFGATRWTMVDVDTTPVLEAPAAVEVLRAYAGLTVEQSPLLEPAVLRLVPRSGGSALAWRLALSVEGDPGRWEGLVDAHDGHVLAFYDAAHYAQVKGGVHPESVDGICPSGCEQPGFPMPYAAVTVNGAPVASSSLGMFACTPAGATAVTQLASPTVRISDACGLVSESALCGGDLDLSVNTGTNCTVPPGHTAGDTKASRTAFYTVSRLKERARSWLPANTWLSSVQTFVFTNVNATCNARWSGGTLSLYREGGGCRNTGELAGVIAHEWGHGMDENDGGPFTNPSEAYADIVEILHDHTSCIGRGFVSTNCGGYGNPCLACTGIRDMDWSARNAQAPTTLTTVSSTCPGGVGPCSRSPHCESYVVGEAIWDLAVRDLTAAPFGLDLPSAWQLVDRLWYTTRTGSFGPMYQCTPPAGGCIASALYLQMLAADDDNGNIVDGTPHMSAIHAAFDRHTIACNTPSVTNTPLSPVVLALTLNGSAGAGAVNLSWISTPAPGAASWRLLRNDLGCGSSFTTVATLPGTATTFSDTGLPVGFPLNYRVQAVHANPAHESRVSNCLTVGAAAPPRPVPSMTASRVDSSTIAVGWDASCASANHEILYGGLADLPAYALAGAVCGIGTSGSFTWSGVPGGNVWFVVTGVNGSGTEASWGPATAGERNGALASGQCGNIARSNSESCP